jgi:heme-degrading monooxygenase HmoA
MIVEHAILQVAPERAAAFEKAMSEARHIIAAQPGFRSIKVLRSAEQFGDYLLLVEWDDIASHQKGFRASPDYQRWKDLLHDFYDDLPTVDYFENDITNAIN